eukprot:6623350-Lingulodinium_polyedra.AAC.1
MRPRTALVAGPHALVPRRCALPPRWQRGPRRGRGGHAGGPGLGRGHRPGRQCTGPAAPPGGAT